jgi:preprotein translocase subunit SecG
MYYLILTLLIIDALLLATVVLLQAGQGGGLASLGGGQADSVLGGRQAVTLLTRMSWYCGGIFLVLSLILSVMSANRRAGPSSLQERIRAGQTQQQAPVGPATLPLNTTPPPAAAGESAGTAPAAGQPATPQPPSK